MAQEFEKMQIANAPMMQMNHFAHIQQQPADLNSMWDSAAQVTAQPETQTANAEQMTAGQSFQQPWMNPMMMGRGPMAGPIFQPPPQLVQQTQNIQKEADAEQKEAKEE